MSTHTGTLTRVEARRTIAHRPQWIPHGLAARLLGGRPSLVLAARPAPPARLAPAPGRDAVGAHGEAVGHDDLVTTARTYTHTLVSETELDYADLSPELIRCRPR
jgi:hypothetical protein